MQIMPQLPGESFHTCVTSPPYWGLRDYGIPPTDWPETTYTPMPAAAGDCASMDRLPGAGADPGNVCRS